MLRVVNVPNRGQIDNLPRDAVVECLADVGALGVRPILAARSAGGPDADALGTLAP